MVTQKQPVWKVPYLLGFFSTHCRTDFLFSVWYDQHYLKWRQNLVLTRMNCTFPVETEKQYELAKGGSAGLDSWEWECRELIMKVHYYTLADVNMYVCSALWVVGCLVGKIMFCDKKLGMVHRNVIFGNGCFFSGFLRSCLHCLAVGIMVLVVLGVALWGEKFQAENLVVTGILLLDSFL